MVRLVVTCAGCGNKHFGAPGAPPGQCAACGNTFTFPDGVRTPSPRKHLCSNCWTEAVLTDKTFYCKVCSQKISRLYGGQAVLDTNSTSARLARVPVENGLPAPGGGAVSDSGGAPTVPRPTVQLSPADINEDLGAQAVPIPPGGNGPASADEAENARLRAHIEELERQLRVLAESVKAEKAQPAAAAEVPTPPPAGGDAEAVKETMLEQMEKMMRQYQLVLKGMDEQMRELFSRTHLVRKRLEDDAAELALSVAGMESRLREQIESEIAKMEDRLVRLRYSAPRRPPSHHYHVTPPAAGGDEDEELPSAR